MIALAALTALGIWALLSALWSPAPDIAIGDGQRILVYALCFGLGVGLCNLLGPRIEPGAGPTRRRRRVAGLITVDLAGDRRRPPSDLLEIDGTLDFPLGYRNAEAAFFAIALFPALGLAADRELDWRLRAGGAGDRDPVHRPPAARPEPRLDSGDGVALIVYALVSPRRLPGPDLAGARGGPRARDPPGR